MLSEDPIEDNLTVSIDNTQIIPDEEVSLLGVTLENNVNFNSHISKICKEASKRINTLWALQIILTIHKRIWCKFIILFTL